MADDEAQDGTEEGPWPGVDPDLTREMIITLAPGQEEWGRRRIAEILTDIEIIRRRMGSATTAEAIDLTNLTVDHFGKLETMRERFRQAGIAIVVPFPSMTLHGGALAHGLDDADRRAPASNAEPALLPEREPDARGSRAEICRFLGYAESTTRKRLMKEQGRGLVLDVSTDGFYRVWVTDKSKLRRSLKANKDR